MPDYFWMLVAFFFAAIVFGVFIGRILTNHQNTQAEIARERELEAHRAYADAPRHRRDMTA